MSSPTVTDWMQGIGTIAALGLSIGSLWWQWRVFQNANRERITVEAERQHGGAWTAKISIEAPNRSTALRASIEIMGWSSARLFFDDGPLWLTYDDDFRTVERTSWSDLRSDKDLHRTMVWTDLDFEEAPSKHAIGFFGIFPTDEYCQLKITVASQPAGKRLFSRVIDLSPVIPPDE